MSVYVSVSVSISVSVSSDSHPFRFDWFPDHEKLIPTPSESCIVAIQITHLCQMRQLWAWNKSKNWQEFWCSVNAATDTETEADTETDSDMARCEHTFMGDSWQFCRITAWCLLCDGIQIRQQLLTHWGRDKMDAISQTTCSSAFSWMKMFEFQLIFHWSLFLRVQLTIFQHWFR